jgi:hypothetical protein
MTRSLLPVSFCIQLGLALLFPGPALSQVSDSLRIDPTVQIVPDTVGQAPDSLPSLSPGGAFLRSALIPGWGHARIGAQGRGAFYFAVESGIAFMLLKSHSRLEVARDRLALWESVVTARLQAQGIEDPVEIEAALAEDENVSDLRGLEEARAEQREDWMALAIFFVFLGGADAFVSAHLADFPAPVEVDVDAGQSGRVEIGFSVPVGFD